MSYSAATMLRILSIILVPSLLIPTAFSADPLSFGCAKESIDDKAYTKILNTLLDDLQTKTPITGFANSSLSSPYGHVKVFAIALCRHGVPSLDCGACLRNASTQINGSCFGSREAVIWYDYCQLKYSDHNFFGEIDTQFQVALENTVSKDYPVQFNATVTEALLNITKQVNETSKWFARSETNFPKNRSIKVYTMALCTWDLVRIDCYKCLVDAVESLPGYSSEAKGKNYTVGASVLTPNCGVRYETYDFLIHNY